MSLPNITQGQGQRGQKDQFAEAEKRRQREDLQRSIIILESDYQKKLAQRVTIDADMRKLKKEEMMIRVNQRNIQEEIKRLDQEVMIIENEIKGLKKKLNLL